MTKSEYQRRARQEENLSRLGLSGIDAETLRRCSRTLSRWAEMECGNGNAYASRCIERDEKTGKPFLVTYPNAGKSYRTAVRDREAGALRRVGKICRAHKLTFYHQPDCRGAALYIGREPLTSLNYNRDGIPVY